ncbi:MAG: hypothetical protein WB992_05970 [Bryobacteraceae bacterium]
MRFSLLAACIGVLTIIAACSRKSIPIPAPANISRNDRSYEDLKAGSRLRIVVPLLKSGGFRVTGSAQQSQGSTITLHTEDLIGYETSYYSVNGNRNGRVRLKFLSAETTREGKTVPEPNPPMLPFRLPREPAHIRLIYLVRVSEADHNMAIIASKRVDALEAFTKQLKERPSICNEGKETFCSWVPEGIAVRPEAQ